MSRGTPMRTCANCSGFFLTWELIPDGDPYFCPKCKAKLFAHADSKFDPQSGDRVREISNMTGPFSDLLVIARDRDTVTVQPLGDPDRRRDVPVGRLTRGVGR